MTDLVDNSEKASTRNTLVGAMSVFRHELRILFYQPLSYLFQLGFLSVLAASIFLIVDFYATDEASIRPMLIFLPWIAMILVPALAMRAWVEDHSDRSIELMLTLPVSHGGVVVGKFLAGYFILIITLLFTAPLVMTLYYLGEPDPGVLFTGYLGSIFLLGAYYAISLLAAALTREQVAAFVISISFLFLLQLLGWDVFSRLLKGSVSPSILEALSLYSPNTWLLYMILGVIDFASIFYFSAVSIASLFGTTLLIDARRHGQISSRKIAKGLGIMVIIISLLAILIPAAKRLPGILDLTAEREFTLHDGTINILQQLPSGSKVTFYWSAEEPTVPTNIKSHASRVHELLKTLVNRSDGRLSMHTVDPKPDTDEELQAIANGVKKVPMSSGDYFYLGLTFQHHDRIGNIPYLDIRRDRHLEYDIAVGLNGLGRVRTPKIGILSPLIPSTAVKNEREGMSFLAELKRAYDVAIIPHFKKTLPDELDALILIDATILRQEMLYSIDQFVMKGGGLVVMMDPYLRFNRSSNLVNPQPSDEINDISDILQKYGIHYLGENVIGDAKLASAVADQNGERFSFPFWMRVPESSLSNGHPVTADLNELFMVEPGALELLEPRRGTRLISTTENSGRLSRKNFADKTPRALTLAFTPDQFKHTIAASMQGPFESAYKNPPNDIVTDGYLPRSQDSSSSLFVIADIDWLFDPFSLQRKEVGDKVLVRPLNDNLSFLLNIVEYASGDKALIAIRSRGRLQRSFTRIAQLFQAAHRKHKGEEQRLIGYVAKIEKQIVTQSVNSNPERAGNIPPQLQQHLKTLRLEMLKARRELRSVRRQIREKVENLSQLLTVINIVAGPLFVLALAGIVVIFRRKRLSF